VIRLLLAALLLAGCSERQPPCEENPPFYLKGTAHDCDARR
jgi:hypothetical protein